MLIKIKNHNIKPKYSKRAQAWNDKERLKSARMKDGAGYGVLVTWVVGNWEKVVGRKFPRNPLVYNFPKELICTWYFYNKF